MKFAKFRKKLRKNILWFIIGPSILLQVLEKGSFSRSLVAYFALVIMILFALDGLLNLFQVIYYKLVVRKTQKEGFNEDYIKSEIEKVEKCERLSDNKKKEIIDRMQKALSLLQKA